MKDQINTIREALDALTTTSTSDEVLRMKWNAKAKLSELEAMVGEQEPVAWQILNGVCHAGIRSSEALTKEAAAGMQKTHDLGGSLAAFHVRPLYAAPVAQQARTDLEAENKRLKRHSEELSFLHGDLLLWTEWAVDKGNANCDIEEAWARYEEWLQARAALKDPK